MVTEITHELYGAPSKKLHVTETYDRILNLPDDIVSLILSRLNPVQAVRLSVLSRDWKYKLVTSLTTIHIFRTTFNINVSSLTCFVNLKTLIVYGNFVINIRNEHSTNTRRMLLNFPVLNDLLLVNCKWLDVDYVEIQAPELINFEVNNFGHELRARDYEVKICGAKITKFMTSSGKIDNFVVTAPAVTHACLDHSSIEDLALRAGVLLNEFRNLQFLKLAGEVFHALTQPKPKSKPLLVFSALHRLKELELHASQKTKTCVSNRDVLELLQGLKSLEAIKIVVDGDTKRGRPLPLRSRSCAFPSLKYFEIIGFNGGRNGVDLVGRILNSAKNLEKAFLFVLERNEIISSQVSKLRPKDSKCVLCVAKKVESRNTDPRRHVLPIYRHIIREDMFYLFTGIQPQFELIRSLLVLCLQMLFVFSFDDSEILVAWENCFSGRSSKSWKNNLYLAFDY